MKWQEYIISDKEILSGKPVIKGTRLSVEFILARLADGRTEQMLFENYPFLNKQTLQPVCAFALDDIHDVVLVDWQILNHEFSRR